MKRESPESLQRKVHDLENHVLELELAATFRDRDVRGLKAQVQQSRTAEVTAYKALAKANAQAHALLEERGAVRSGVAAVSNALNARIPVCTSVLERCEKVLLQLMDTTIEDVSGKEEESDEPPFTSTQSRKRARTSPEGIDNPKPFVREYKPARPPWVRAKLIVMGQTPGPVGSTLSQGQ
ncbi:hypothetical protein OF83DRAFT_1179811 [Amylostereum chailletii]|nr:hypothetical protein OF83DRAFT_1179811 [Amylostereum chailletii]